jgi:hypothetical protein
MADGWLVAHPDRTAFFWDYFRVGGNPGAIRVALCMQLAG